MAIDIGRAKVHQSSGKSTLIFTVVVNLFILSFFKYYGFLMDTVNGILGTDIKYTALAPVSYTNLVIPVLHTSEIS